MHTRRLVRFLGLPTLMAGILCTASAAVAGTLKVTSFPSGAQVAIDGVNTGKVTPMNIALTDGDHVVTVEIPGSGWSRDTRVVTIVSGNNDLSVTLLPSITQGPQGPPGPQGTPGAPGAPATVRAAAALECATGGIVVTSGDGLTAIPVCNGARGPEGHQGIQGVAGPAGPAGPPGGVPVVEPTTLVGFASNLRVVVGGFNGEFGLSPIYVEVGTVEEALGDGRLRYRPGKLRLAPFALAARQSTEIDQLEDWLQMVREGRVDAARRAISIELLDLRLDEVELAVHLTDCLPSTLGAGASVTDFTSVIVECNSNAVSVSSVSGGLSGLHRVVETSRRALKVNGDTQIVAEVAGGVERIAGLLVDGRAPRTTIDPLRMRAGSLVEAPFDVRGLADWVIASLGRDPNGQFRDAELQVIENDGRLATVALYRDVFLTGIGLLDPARALGGEHDLLPVGFDLVLQPNGRQ